LHRDNDKLLNAKLILLNLGSPNVFISLSMKVLINTFSYKNMVPMSYKYVSVHMEYLDLHYIYLI